MATREKVLTATAARGWKPLQMARMSGVSVTTANAFLGGKTVEPGWSVIVRMARTLGISLDWLADDAAPDHVIPPHAIVQALPGTPVVPVAPISAYHPAPIGPARDLSGHGQPIADHDTRPVADRPAVRGRKSSGIKKRRGK